MTKISCRLFLFFFRRVRVDRDLSLFLLGKRSEVGILGMSADVTESSGLGLCRTRRTWKPNVQEKRLFSYALDRHIRVKVTTHALRCIDKAGGVDEYLLKTPYHRMDTEMGLLWKAKIEKLYEELGQAEVFFFSPEEEARIGAGFEEYRAAKRAARRSSARRPGAAGEAAPSQDPAAGGAAP